MENNKALERKIPVETYSRIVGFFSPVKSWNPGKQEEFKERLTLKIGNETKDNGKQGVKNS